MANNTVFPSTFQHLSISSGIRAAMSRNPEKQCFKHGQHTRTYKDLVSRMDRISSGFINDLKLQPDDHAAIVAGNSIEYMEIILGASQANIAMATINPKLSVTEIVAICDDAEAKVLFLDATMTEILNGIEFRTIKKVISIDDHLEQWLQKCKPMMEYPVVKEWDVFTIPYTSGTTGKPKGVLVPHRSRVLTLFGMAVEYGCYSPEDRFLAIAPMCHGAGMIFSLAPIFFGGYAEIMDRFDPEEIVTTFKKENITGFFGVPTHFHGITGLEKSVLTKNQSSSLDTIISNAAALPQTTKEKIVEIFGNHVLHETYGSTEGGIVSNLRPPDQLRKEQCVGQAFPCTTVKILDASGEECSPDEVGELFSTSPYLFNGYWKRPEETEEAVHDGWLTVGDLAKKDSEGYLYIVDRKNDMVISGGVNIYPRETEEVLIRHPDILDVAVVGIADEKWGESIKAFLVTRNNIDLNLEAVRAFCEDQISTIKMPKAVNIIDEIPRNAGGKVLKKSLRKIN